MVRSRADRADRADRAGGVYGSVGAVALLMAAGYVSPFCFFFCFYCIQFYLIRPRHCAAVHVPEPLPVPVPVDSMP